MLIELKSIRPITIGQAIRIARQRRGLTLAQVGELMGVSRASLSKIELADSITFKKLVDVARSLGCKPSDIVKLTEEDKVDPFDMLRTLVDRDALNENAHITDSEEGTSLYEDVLNILNRRDD